MANQDTFARNPYFQADFTAEEFSARRARVMDAMGREGVAVLAGAGESPGFDPFRQTNDFYYLCGVEVPHAYLLLDAAKGTSTVYLPLRNEKHEATDGPSLCADDADFVIARTGVQEAKPAAAILDDLKGRTLFYLPSGEAEGPRMCQDTLRHRRRCIEADPLGGAESDEVRLLARAARLSPGAAIRDLTPILQRLRLIKSPQELRLVRRASELAALAVVEAMKSTRPGVIEYQLGAVADLVYLAHGARGCGYRAIIAGGDNIRMMHYWRNNAPLRDGDLVLMDYAPDVGNYTSDIGRMWPVNGTFAPWQREVYGFVVEYHKLLLAAIRPGILPEDVLAEAAARMRPRLETWSFSRPAFRAAAQKMLESKRPMSHGVGMAVHEAQSYFGRPMQEGLVFAVDPEMFIPEEGLYIRCEDTVAITAAGCENLTALAPLELDETERAVGRDGILDRVPALTVS